MSAYIQIKAKYLCILIIICSLVFKDTFAQSQKDYNSYKIVFTKYNLTSDYLDGSDVFIFDPSDTTSCLSDYSKKSKMPKISSDGSFVAYTLNDTFLIIVNSYNSIKDTLKLNIGKYIWYPDGKQIIYQDYTGIKSFNVETKTTRTISYDNGILPFSISPDGKIILCQQMKLINGKILYQMFLVTETSPNVKTLDGPGAEKRFGSFSYDNNYIVYTGGNQDLMDDLYSYNLSTNTYQRLTECNGEDLEAVYSPDGQSICFVSTRLQDNRGNYKLYVMKYDGSDQKMIYEKFATNIRWPKDSEYIYFLGLDGIYRVKPDGSGLLKIVDEGNASYISDFDITYCSDPHSSVENEGELQRDFRLFQNYPNPFNPATTIQFYLQKASNVELKIFDLLGQKIITLLNESKNAGVYNIVWNGNDDANNFVPSGVYICNIKAGNYIKSLKMILLR